MRSVELHLPAPHLTLQKTFGASEVRETNGVWVDSVECGQYVDEGLRDGPRPFGP
jgi:hypothetical protein